MAAGAGAGRDANLAAAPRRRRAEVSRGAPRRAEPPAPTWFRPAPLSAARPASDPFPRRAYLLAEGGREANVHPADYILERAPTPPKGRGAGGGATLRKMEAGVQQRGPRPERRARPSKRPSQPPFETSGRRPQGFWVR